MVSLTTTVYSKSSHNGHIHELELAFSYFMEDKYSTDVNKTSFILCSTPTLVQEELDHLNIYK